MTIRFSCPTCNKTLAVADDKAGVKVACPGCKRPFRVPTNGQAGSGDGHATKSTSAAAAGAATVSGPKTRRGTDTPHALSEWGQVDAVLDEAIEVIDRPLNADEEAQVRANLTRYAASVPHHDLQALGKQIKITKARESRSYRVVLDSLFETRQVTRKEEPFQGGDVPPPSITEQSIRVWSYPYPTGEEFRNGTMENVVEQSKEVRTCPKCGGQKATSCDGCSGGGAVACPGCRGSGATECGRCGGDGYREVKTGTQQRWVKCGCCGGTGQWYPDSYGPKDHRCPECAGNGRVPKDEDVYQAVPCTCGTGKVQCPTCGGHGKVRCPKCTGSGKLPCQSCKANGRLLSYLCVVQSFEPINQTITAACAAIEDQQISRMLQQSDYAPLFTLATTDIPDALKLTSGAEQVRAGIVKAFDAAQARVSEENHLTRQRLQVSVASVLEVVYQHKDKDYTAWFIGKQLKAHAPVNPVTDALQQKVKEAVKTWKKGDQKDAVLILNEVTDMANADPHCHAAHEEVRDTIPTDLESGVRWHRLKPKLIVGAIVGGVAVLAVVLLIGFALFRSKSRHNGPGRMPSFIGVEQPGGQPPAFPGRGGTERLAVVQFRDRTIAIPKGGKATVRLTVQPAGRIDGNLSLKLEASRGLTVPAQVVVEQGRQEVEIEVNAGNEAGVFSIRAVPENFNGGPFAAECRVTVGAAAGLPGGRGGLPTLPGFPK